MLAIGCVFDMKVESTSDSEENDSGLKFLVLTFVATIHFVTSVCSCTSDWDSYCSGCNEWSFICGFANHYKKMQRYGHVISFTLFPLSNSAGSKTSVEGVSLR